MYSFKSLTSITWRISSTQLIRRHHWTMFHATTVMMSRSLPKIWKRKTKDCKTSSSIVAHFCPLLHSFIFAKGKSGMMSIPGNVNVSSHHTRARGRLLSDGLTCSTINQVREIKTVEPNLTDWARLYPFTDWICDGIAPYLILPRLERSRFVMP
jgi:hypothetical protein